MTDDEPDSEPTDEPAPESTDEPASESTGEPAPAPAHEPAPEPSSEPAPEPADEPADDGRDVRNLLLRGALLVLGVLAVVALFQFYTSANAAIGQWIGHEFRALFRAAFNLVVLLTAGIGISLIVRELT